jgi:hypothetical protein
VEDGVELCLKVDTFAQTIRSDQDVPAVRLKFLDAFAADLVRIVAGDGGDS